VGAGEGQTACWLAQQGFSVTALDFSMVGLEKLEARAKQLGLAIKTTMTAIETFDYPNAFDAVLFMFVLHHLNTESAAKVLQTAQAHTKPGGIHLIATFGNEGGLYERAKKSGRFYPAAQDLEGLYEDWQLREVSQFDRESIAKDKSGAPLVNEVLLFVAQKPVS
jgi:cyclopropane fatty-acyl-phospholipid synthase-like methyltransferase